MTDLAKHRMTADEFLVWAEGQDERWELQDGAPVAMSPERIAHTETKGEAYSALKNAIALAKAPCRALTEGGAVRIDAGTVFEPDVLVYCGPRLPADALEVSSPVIIVEVLSPGTAARDHGVKLEGYFSLPSVMHYLILDAERRRVVHHKRGRDDALETRIWRDGVLRLDPPGLEVPVADLFAPE
jgi:Uma2 family endonuclease